MIFFKTIYFTINAVYTLTQCLTIYNRLLQYPVRTGRSTSAVIFNNIRRRKKEEGKVPGSDQALSQ